MRHKQIRLLFARLVQLFTSEFCPNASVCCYSSISTSDGAISCGLNSTCSAHSLGCRLIG
ncbi:unnamed protein product, partial [Ixodes persulcatus]